MTDSRITALRAELRDDTAFVATATPRLSWTVDSARAGWVQAAADLTDGSATVTRDGRDSALVTWPFAPLAAGETREISVRARATDGAETPWSAVLRVEAGYLADGEWVAQPIGLADAARGAQPALVRTSFTIDRPVRRALLFWTALGVAEPELNGAAVSDDVLSPGWTSYRDRLVHETVDVTALIREGANVRGAPIAGAWYTEKYGFHGFEARLYGTQPSFLAQLRVTYADGAVETVAATGDGWSAFGDGPVVDSGIYAGEHQDLRLAVPGWSASGFDDSDWAPARIGAAANPSYENVPVPEARIAPPVRRIQSLPVVTTIATPSGGTILDFGQNLVGRLRMRVRDAAGQRVVIRHAEVLEDGELSIRPLRNAAATATFDLAGGAETL
jgi:alpha-L-rhamnosidase